MSTMHVRGCPDERYVPGIPATGTRVTTTEESPLARSKRWLITAARILKAYAQLTEAGDVRGAQAALKSYREALRTSEDCAYEASR